MVFRPTHPKKPKPPKPPKPTGPSGPTAPTAPTAATGPTGPTTPVTITAQTDFRKTGNTTRQAFREALRRTVNSGQQNDALVNEADAIYDVVAAKGLTRLYAAQAWHERHNDTYTPDEAYYPHSWRNVMATKTAGAFMRFASYLDGARYWSQRILDPAGPFAKADALAEYIHVYAPSWDGNDEAKYVADLVKQINAWPLLGAVEPGPTGPTGTTGPTSPTTPLPPGLVGHIVAGSDKPLWLPDDLAFSLALTPKGPNRSGQILRWTGCTQHETGNERAGTGARMHANWQNSGTPGHPDGKIGVHFYVDDREAIQCIPINEQGVHSGDWRNQEHVAVELCVNRDRNKARAERNAAALMAGLLDILDRFAVEAMYPHRMPKPQASGCPVYLGARWHEYEREIDARLVAMRPGPAKG